MSEIQAAILTKFNLVIGAHKADLKEALAARTLPPTAFFGVLNSQLKQQAEAEVAADLMPSGKVINMPLIQADEAESIHTASEPAAQMPSPVDARTQVAELSAQVIPLPVTTSNAVARQGMDKPPQRSSESETLPEPELDAISAPPPIATKSAASTLEKAATHGGMPAIHAGNGQALPLEHLAEQSRTSFAPATPEVEQALTESPIAHSGSSSIAPRSDAATAIVSLPHPFAQALRQAETRINAAIEAPLRSPAFIPELGDRVIWLATRQGQFAELSLTPPQMGTLEVRLSLSGSDASAQFFSSNPVVREVIDGALPRLRELMSQAGINLGEAEVRGEAFERHEQAGSREPAATSNKAIPAQLHPTAGSGGALSHGSGLVDLYI